MAYVPVIDIDRDPDTVGAELDDVCHHVGFFQIVGHGIPESAISAAWTAAERFFALPLADRLTVRSPSGGYPYGYVPFAGEAVGRSVGGTAPADLKETFNSGPVDQPVHELLDPDEAVVYSPNLWPAMLPDLEQTWTAYHRLLLELSGRLMELFARGLALPPDYFAAHIDRSPSALRAVCYPGRATAPQQPGQLRAGSHTDYGILTVLRQDDIGGLEVLDQHDTWTAVPSIPGAFVVNIGDLMARWTNDRWRSTLHRVVDVAGGADGVPSRQSMPFFFNANWDAEVKCIPTCLAPGAEPTYEPVLAGPHLLRKFRSTVLT